MARAPWWPSCRSLAPALSSCLSSLVIDSATCQVVQRIDYDALGRITLETNPGFQLLGFAGGLYDPQTGLVRFGARAYDPAVGRWTAKDPPGFAAGDTSLYGCVVQGPNDRIDPTGLAPGPGVFERARGLMAQRMSEVQQAGDTQRVDSRQALPHNPPRARPPTDRDGPAAGSGSGPDLTARRSCARASLPRAACRGAGASGSGVRGSLRDRGARALPRGRAGRR
ncbi:MAG TPA: RHS repeat-associated core domain-containing protein [Thermoanaerobaculia bacterium]|nr:RHS repeat-associated core domain-containing protein [Thermoanaerobaculia bacterium]